MTGSLPRLLLVDDEANIIMRVTRRLHREYRTFLASDGMEALKLLAAKGAMLRVMMAE